MQALKLALQEEKLSVELWICPEAPCDNSRFARGVAKCGDTDLSRVSFRSCEASTYTPIFKIACPTTKISPSLQPIAVNPTMRFRGILRYFSPEQTKVSSKVLGSPSHGPLLSTRCGLEAVWTDFGNALLIHPWSSTKRSVPHAPQHSPAILKPTPAEGGTIFGR